MRFVTYCRVSTDKQGIKGLGMDAQAALIEAHVRQTRGDVVAEFVEVETGKIAARPQLQAALAHCKAVGAVLLIAKLDRLARNVHFVSGLMESGVEFVAADMPTANRLTIHIMAAFAEHEALMISQRTKAALAQAKERGVQLGGYRERAAITPAKRAASLQKRQDSARLRGVSVLPMIQAIKSTGTSTLRGIAAALNASGVTAPRGGQWTASQVSRLEALGA